jgi:hypothetical protein
MESKGGMTVSTHKKQLAALQAWQVNLRRATTSRATVNRAQAAASPSHRGATAASSASSVPASASTAAESPPPPIRVNADSSQRRFEPPPIRVRRRLPARLHRRRRKEQAVRV